MNKKFIYFSGNQQSMISFIKIKNLHNLNCQEVPQVFISGWLPYCSIIRYRRQLSKQVPFSVVKIHFLNNAV